MTREEQDFIGAMNMCDEISNEAYKKIMCHCEEQEPCEDAISRDHFDTRVRSALTMTWGELTDDFTDGVCTVLELLKTEPSVNPQPKIGHWVQTNEFFINQDGQFIYKFICSECKSLSYFRKSNKKAIGANVCPNCGAKMVESQESEDKNDKRRSDK